MSSETAERMQASDVRLWRRESMAQEGVGWRRVRRMTQTGQLIVLRSGIFVRRVDWTALKPEQQMVLRARALATTSGTRVNSHLTAAAAHGLPITRADLVPVHTTAPEPRGGALQGVIRHRGPVDDDELAIVDGLLCTNLARTIADVARTARPETAISVVDAALRSVAVRGRTYASDVADELREEAKAIATRSAHGVARAHRILDFGDGRADLPGESISRFYIVCLGFAVPQLQVPVPGPKGTRYFVDLGLDDVDGFGEVDGKAKYIDPILLNGRDSQDILLAEKEREDWIRGTTTRTFVRWGARHYRTPESLGRRLAAFGIHPPRR